MTIRIRDVLLRVMLCLAVTAAVLLPAKAQEEGGIRIRLSDGEEGTRKEGVEFACTKVADIVDGIYRGGHYTEGMYIGENSTAGELEEAAVVIAGRIQTPDRKVHTNENGEADIPGLETGVYLLQVTGQADYEKVSPFLVPVPFWDERAGEMNYDIEVWPKHEAEVPEEPVAPQTNLDSSYRERMILSGICGLSALVIFAALRRKHE